MTNSSVGATGQVGRPRDPALEGAVLSAAVDQLIEGGYAGATVEAVARAAGTGKAAIYRRWPSKSALMIAAAQSLEIEPTVPDTGTLRGDLIVCAQHFTTPDRRGALVLASLLGEVKRDPELGQAAYESIGRPPAAAFMAVIERWKSCGLVPASAPVDLLGAILPAFAFRTMTLHSRQLDHATVLRVIDGVLLPALAEGTDAAPGGEDCR